MKKQIIITIIFTLAFATISFSQVKQISLDEYYTVGTNGYKLLYENPLRMIGKVEIFENGAVISSMTIVEENLPPGRSRSLRVEKKDGKETSLELILIGTLQYRRENNDKWTARELRGMTSRTGTSGGASCTQYTEDSDFIEGGSVRKLKLFKVIQSPEGLMFDEFIDWFDQRGFFVRRERIKGNLEPKTITSRSVSTYQYDPNDLKIEAPIVSEDVKP